MPFTLAHPAAVLPLRRLGLPMTAMVAGSLVPDLPIYVGFQDARSFTHSPLGVVTIDLALGMTGLLLWYVLFRRPLVDLAPDRWRARLPETVRVGPRVWLLAGPGVLVGAATHVVWDAFTHEGAWGVGRLAPLRESLLGVEVYEWAQHGCSVLGLAIVVVAARRYWARLPELPPRPDPLVGRWALVVALSWGGLLGMGIAVLVWPWGLEAMAYYGVITTMLVAGFGATCVCLWWHVKRRLRVPSRQDA
jgi:hypothetical protein